jgi:hypothetical protein
MFEPARDTDLSVFPFSVDDARVKASPKIEEFLLNLPTVCALVPEELESVCTRENT